MSFFRSLFGVGVLTSGPIFGAIIDTSGRGPIYVTA
jgi:hypothetical protein